MEELAAVPVRAGDEPRHLGRRLEGSSLVFKLLRASVDEDVRLPVPLARELRAGEHRLAPLDALLALLERGVEDGGGSLGDMEVVVLLLQSVDRLLPEGRRAAGRVAREEAGVLAEELVHVHRLNRVDLGKHCMWRLCHRSFSFSVLNYTILSAGYPVGISTSRSWEIGGVEGVAGRVAA